jgi:hypothetical protein
MKHQYVKGNRSVWQWMKDLAIGEESEPLAEGESSAYVTAKRFGITIETRSLPTGDFIVKRVG